MAAHDLHGKTELWLDDTLQARTVKYTGRPSKCRSRSRRAGPSPTKHRQAGVSASDSSTPRSASRFFSARPAALPGHALLPSL